MPPRGAVAVPRGPESLSELQRKLCALTIAHDNQNLELAQLRRENVALRQRTTYLEAELHRCASARATTDHDHADLIISP